MAIILYHNITLLYQIMYNVSFSVDFLSRVSVLTRDIDNNKSARLSVRLSVCNVPVSDENGLTYRHSFFHHTVAQSF